MLSAKQPAINGGGGGNSGSGGGTSFRLMDVPTDLLEQVIRHLPSFDIAQAACTCAAMHCASSSRTVWQHRMECEYERVIVAAFDGQCPEPAGTSWLTHYLTFGRQWMWHTRALGKVILEIDGYVYDITSYVDRHPGEPDLVRAPGSLRPDPRLSALRTDTQMPPSCAASGSSRDGCLGGVCGHRSYRERAKHLSGLQHRAQIRPRAPRSHAIYASGIAVALRDSRSVE